MDYCEAYWRKRNAEENAERRRRIAFAMAWNDEKLKSEPAPKFCPHCHCQLTDLGKCVNGCDD